MKERMSSRERILASVRREPLDQVPADIWYTPEVMEDLQSHFGVATEPEVFSALGVDKIYMLEAPFTDSRNGSRTVWGNEVRRIANDSGGTYEEIVTYPLLTAESVGEAGAYRWPDADAFDYGTLRSSFLRHRDEAKMLSFISIFENYCKLRPMDKALMDLYIFPDMAEYIIDRLLQLQKAYIIRSFETCGEIPDFVYLSDDMGMQDRALFGLDIWEHFFREPYRELIDLIHSSGSLAFYHSDGAAFDVLKEMVSLGVDVVNPLQHVCPGMEKERLQLELGGRVCFHGGVENQQILPFGTPDDVRAEVIENIAVLGARGGYICAPCHNIQPGTPVENIIALYEAVREAGTQ